MLKNDIHKSLFGNIDFLSYGACVIVKKGLEKKVSQNGKNGEFFLRDLHTLEKHKAKYQLYKNFSHKKYTALGLLVDTRH